jgi:hypothetical protein
LSYERIYFRPPHCERDYNAEFKRWIFSQNTETLLCFADRIPYDRFETLLFEIVDHPKCDIAVAAMLFWKEVNCCFRNPERLKGTLTENILRNFQAGKYRKSDFTLDRKIIADKVFSYAELLQKTEPSQQPFVVPRELIGPFEGRQAIFEWPEPELAKELAELFRECSITPPEREAPTLPEGQPEFVNIWHYHILPELDDTKLAAIPIQDDLGYIKAVYGSVKEFAAAGAMLEDDMLYLGKKMLPFGRKIKSELRKARMSHVEFSPWRYHYSASQTDFSPSG